MPGFLLTQGSQVVCSHGGKAIPTVPNPRVRIMGMPTTLLGPSWVISGCALPPPPIANGPCISGNFITASTRVRSSGVPVLLMDSQSICVPTGAPLNVLFANARVKAQ